MANEERDNVLDRIRMFFDSWLMPVAGGCLSVLVLAQCITSIPAVRNYVDGVTGHFVLAQSNESTPQTTTETSQVSLYAAPDGAHPEVKVLLNGSEVGTFLNSQLDVSLHQGDIVTIKNLGPTTVVISVDQNDPNLLRPAPGQTWSVDPGTSIQMPAAQFLQ